jgi:hypothetical protein
MLIDYLVMEDNIMLGWIFCMPIDYLVIDYLYAG